MDREASLVAQLIKNPPAMRETWVPSLDSIPGLGRSPGEGNGYPLQYSCLKNSMDCIVHRITKSWTRLSNCHFHFSLWDRVVSSGHCSILFLTACSADCTSNHFLAYLHASSCDQRVVPVALQPFHLFWKWNTFGQFGMAWMKKVPRALLSYLLWKCFLQPPSCCIWRKALLGICPTFNLKSKDLEFWNWPMEQRLKALYSYSISRFSYCLGIYLVPFHKHIF